MKIQRLALVLTIFNLGLLAFLLSQAKSLTAQTVAPVLRTQRLELVDERGQVRSRLNVESGPDAAVVFRMMDQKGLIRVKLGGSEEGSGLVLANDSTEPGVHILAKSTGSSLRLINRDGRERMVTP